MKFEDLRDKHNKEAIQRKPTTYEEAKIQKAFFEWAGVFVPEYSKLIFHISNEGKRNSRFVKSSGIKKGVADVFVSIPSRLYHGFYIEFKTETGKQSADQKEFQEQAEKAGYKYEVCRTASDAINQLREYLKNK